MSTVIFSVKSQGRCCSVGPLWLPDTVEVLSLIVFTRHVEITANKSQTLAGWDIFTGGMFYVGRTEMKTPDGSQSEREWDHRAVVDLPAVSSGLTGLTLTGLSSPARLRTPDTQRDTAGHLLCAHINNNSCSSCSFFTSSTSFTCSSSSPRPPLSILHSIQFSSDVFVRRGRHKALQIYHRPGWI